MNFKKIVLLISIMLCIALLVILKILIEKTACKSEVESLTKEYLRALDEVSYFEKSLFYSLNVSQKIIDTSLIINRNLFTENISLNSVNLALYFPINVCNVCELDFLKFISTQLNSRENEFIIFIPINNYRNFLIFNKIHKLNFQNICAYEDKLLDSQVFAEHGIFFTINNNNLRIDNIYFPYPGRKKQCVKYFETVQKKCNP